MINNQSNRINASFDRITRRCAMRSITPSMRDLLTDDDIDAIESNCPIHADPLDDDKTAQLALFN
jgi:hypothetical protein